MLKEIFIFNTFKCHTSTIWIKRSNISKNTVPNIFFGCCRFFVFTELNQIEKICFINTPFV